MTGVIPIAIGLLVIKKLTGNKPAYPHTMYDCTTGHSVEVATKAEHDDYAAGGWVHSFDKCGLDTPFGRDYGQYDYDDSVDDMSDVQKKWIVVYQDDAVLEGIAVYRVEKLRYDPIRQRRGYYSILNYQIGSLDLWASGAPTSRNDKVFATEQEAIDYYISIGKQRPTTPDEPEGEPMPEPEVGPVDPTTPDDPTPTPQPVDPISPEEPTQPLDPIDPISPINPPSSGYGDYDFGVGVGGF